MGLYKCFALNFDFLWKCQGEIFPVTISPRNVLTFCKLSCTLTCHWLHLEHLEHWPLIHLIGIYNYNMYSLSQHAPSHCLCFLYIFFPPLSPYLCFFCTVWLGFFTLSGSPSTFSLSFSFNLSPLSASHTPRAPLSSLFPFPLPHSSLLSPCSPTLKSWRVQLEYW